jgi:hypothetical protein
MLYGFPSEDGSQEVENGPGHAFALPATHHFSLGVLQRCWAVIDTDAFTLLSYKMK